MKSIHVLLAVVIALLLVICVFVGVLVFREPADNPENTENTTPETTQSTAKNQSAIESAALQEARNLYVEYVASVDYANGAVVAQDLIVKANGKYVLIIDGVVSSTVYHTYKEAQAVVNAHIVKASAGTVTSTAITWPAEADGVLLPAVSPTT